MQAALPTFVPLMQPANSTTQTHTIKLIISVAFVFMMVGTAVELYLLEHYEDVKQLIPLLLIGISGLLLLLLLFIRTKILTLIFKWILGLTALSGVYGTFLHLRANYEFEQEMKPTAGGWDLFIESLSGALPALAPGSMIVLALLGYTYLLLIQQQG